MVNIALDLLSVVARPGCAKDARECLTMSSGLLNVEGLRAVFMIVVYRYRVAIRSGIHRDSATDKSLVQSSCRYMKLDAALGGISRVATLGSRLLDISTGTDNSRDRQP